MEPGIPGPVPRRPQERRWIGEDADVRKVLASRFRPDFRANLPLFALPDEAGKVNVTPRMGALPEVGDGRGRRPRSAPVHASSITSSPS
jgi:hypothetical protein